MNVVMDDFHFRIQLGVDELMAELNSILFIIHETNLILTAENHDP